MPSVLSAARFHVETLEAGSLTAFELGLEGVVLGAIVVTLPVRIARTLLARGLLRKLQVFPRIAATILAAAAGMAIVVMLAAGSATAWRPLAAASLLVLVAEAWRGRFRVRLTPVTVLGVR